MVGTQTNLMAYDIERNSDLFYKVRAVSNLAYSAADGHFSFRFCRTVPTVFK